MLECVVVGRCRQIKRLQELKEGGGTDSHRLHELGLTDAQVSATTKTGAMS